MRNEKTMISLRLFPKKSTILRLKLKNFHFILLILFALLIRLFVGYFTFTNQPSRIIQDNYPQYADALLLGEINTNHFGFGEFDKRLFPAYPILLIIFKPLFQSTVVTGLIINILLSVASLFLMRKIFKDNLVVLFLACLPPIWIQQSTKVSSEALFVFLSLVAMYFLLQKKVVLSGLFLGLAFTTRPVALALLVASILYLLHKKQNLVISKLLGGFLVGGSWLFVYNYVFFGPQEMLQQFHHADRYGNLRLGILQIAQDFYRTLDWKEYRTFFSGTFYVVTNLFALIILAMNRKKSELNLLCFYWLLCVLIFILSISPFKLLDDFGRYALAALPAYGFAFIQSYRNIQTKYFKKNKLLETNGKYI